VFPQKNLKDLEEIPEDVRNELTLISVDSMEEVVQQALLERAAPAEVMKYAHFDTILLPGLETGWTTPPAPAG
jgi:hypothetical protein